MSERQPSGADPVRALGATCAREYLQALQGTGEAPRPDAAVQSGGGWTVLVIAFPPPAGGGAPPGLTPCDRDCLALLAQVSEPLSGARVRRELKKRGLPAWSIATVKRSLAKLKRLGLVA